ncbi:MAG: hypothetical protein ABFD25_16465 [Clostridiaceae bacterium]
MNRFVSILRPPDSAFFQSEGMPSAGVKANDAFSAAGCAIRFIVKENFLQVIAEPSMTPVLRIKLRWRGDFSFLKYILQDAWCVALGDLSWNPVRPEAALPWYFMGFDGERTHGYGVRTGCNSFCFWQLDPMGLSLWMDVRNGGDGVILKEPLLCAEICEREGNDSENSFAACQQFSSMMCPEPNLPARPIFGLNNWYYAYGNISRESVLKDAALCCELAAGCKRQPYLLVDDGWEIGRTEEYYGGPFIPSEKMGDMAALARSIVEIGAIPGIWVRPMLTAEPLPEVCFHPENTGSKPGRFLDVTNADALEYIRRLIAGMVRDGYRLIKHDFTCPDFMGEGFLSHVLAKSGWHFADRSRTNAQIMKNLYRVIQDAAGDAYVLGCNTYNHLAAGIHQIQRSGADTSGRVWEITRKYGINTLAFRLHQNNRFFRCDADCPAFTEKVSTELNMRFLELACKSGAAIFTSITPGFLSKDYLARARAAFTEADTPCGIEPLDWHYTSCPMHYKAGGKILSYDWYTPNDGVTMFHTFYAEE